MFKFTLAYMYFFFPHQFGFRWRIEKEVISGKGNFFFKFQFLIGYSYFVTESKSLGKVIPNVIVCKIQSKSREGVLKIYC